MKWLSRERLEVSFKSHKKGQILTWLVICLGIRQEDWRVLGVPVEEEVGVWAERIGIRVEESVGDGVGASGDGGWTVARLWKTKDRRLLTWSLVSDSATSERAAVPLRRQHGWVTENGRNVAAPGCEDGAWEERGRRGRTEGRDWWKELAGRQKCDLSGEVWSKTFEENRTKGCTVSIFISSVALRLYFFSFMLSSSPTSLSSVNVFYPFPRLFLTKQTINNPIIKSHKVVQVLIE